MAKGLELVKVDKNKIEIANNSNKPIIIYKNTKILERKLSDRDKIVNVNLSKVVDGELEVKERMKYSDLNMGGDLTDKQREQILCLANRFRNCFALNEGELGKTNILKHEIKTGDHPPIKQHPNRTSFSQRLEINTQVKQMERNGIIRKSCSPWSSPVVLSRKKDNSWRFCVDYRRLNKITKQDQYPLPRISDIIDRVSGSKFYSTIDLFSAYWQVEMDEKDIEKTAFITPDAFYEFCRLPFGLVNAPGTFQRLIDLVLGDLKWKIAIAYLDDIIVFSKSWEEHLVRLETVFTALERAGLTLKPKKCFFATKKVTCLGHILTPEGVLPDPSKIEAIKNFSEPKNITELRSFLGICGYYRQFIKNFAQIAKPLTNLTSTKIFYKWNPEAEESFQRLKTALMNSPVLVPFNEDRLVEIHADASGYGIGALLVQRDDKNKEHVVAYASRTLNEQEIKWSTSEQECLAIVWALEKFRCYVYGRPVTIVTDHHALCHLASKKSPNRRLTRWTLELQEYDLNVIHKSGKKHTDADFLSRYPLVNVINIDFDLSNIAEEQDRDPILKKLKTLINNKQKLPREFSFVKINNDILMSPGYNLNDLEWKIIIPKHLRLNIIGTFHDSSLAGHLGVTKTWRRIKSRYMWPGLYRDVKKYVISCTSCQFNKIDRRGAQGKLECPDLDLFPFQKIGIDTLGPFTKSKNNNKHIIVATDYLTKWVECRAVPNISAENIAKFILEQIILQHDPPIQMISDRGTSFMSAVVKRLLHLMDIHHCPTSSYHPQANGQCERYNSTLANMLRHYVNEQHNDWDQWLPYVCKAYNTATHEVTGHTPFFLLFAREHKEMTELKNKLKSNLEKLNSEERHEHVESQRALASRRMEEAQAKNKTRYDEGRRDITFKIGDLVLYAKPIRKVGRTEKLLPKYVGPYEVLEVKNPVTYRIKNIKTKREETAHVANLKYFYQRESTSEGNNDRVNLNGDEENYNKYCYPGCELEGEEDELMIICHDKQCTQRWFHFACTGLVIIPGGKWYCDTCVNRRT